MENWLYLCKWSIFFQILICSSWDNFLQMQLLLSFILTKASWRIFAIKEGMSFFHIFRLFSMGHDFFLKLVSTYPSFTSNISVVLSSFTLNFKYVVAEAIRYLKCDLILSQFLDRSAHLYLFQTSITNLVSSCYHVFLFLSPFLMLFFVFIILSLSPTVFPYIILLSSCYHLLLCYSLFLSFY